MWNKYYCIINNSLYKSIIYMQKNKISYYHYYLNLMLPGYIWIGKLEMSFHLHLDYGWYHQMLTKS